MLKPAQLSRENLQQRIQAALGKVPCDLLLRNVRYLDVFSLQWREGDVAIAGGCVVALDPGLKAHREIQAKGKFLVPGFIDAHVHIESSMMTPGDFEQAVIHRGTTSAICDPHELANVLGVSGLTYFLDASEHLKMDLQVMLSSCVPATHLETNGGGTITASDLLPLRSRDKALGLAEVMNVPGVLFGDSAMAEKITSFSDVPMDGHAPLLRGKELSAYAATGISTCHESSELAEAEEKLHKGMRVWIREGSVAKDLETLLPLLNVATSTSLGFCTDDRNPLDIADQGHIDYLIRRSIEKGIAPEVAYRTASWSVARHYGLDRGPHRLGAIAPGYQANLVLLEDPHACAIETVFLKGVATRELAPSKIQAQLTNTIQATIPQPKDLEGPRGQVHVIHVLEGKIVTGRQVLSSEDPEVARLTVLERYGRGGKPANAYVSGFGRELQGAIASSVGHDSHNLIVVGRATSDMQVALASLAESGGGFCVVKDGKVLERLELPFGGLMSQRSPEELKTRLQSLKRASLAIGCQLPEPFLQLAFLSLPVIPSLKLTDKGLVDVDQFKLIPVVAA